MVWTVPSGINSLRVFLPRSSLSSLQTIVNTLRQTDPSKRIHVWNMLGDPAVPFSTTFSKRPSGLLPLPPRDPREATAFFDTTFELDDEAVTEALRGVPVSGSWRRDGDSKVIFLFDSLENSKAWFEAVWEVFDGMVVVLRATGMNLRTQQQLRAEKFTIGTEIQSAMIREKRNF